VQTHPASAFHRCVTLTFDLLTTGSMHAEILPWTMCVCVPSVVLIAQASFPLERGQTHTYTVTDGTMIHRL